MSSKNRNNRDDERNPPYFRVVVAMVSVSNIIWIFGFIAAIVHINWVWFPFFILNSFQGFIIFSAFYGTKKVFKLYISRISNFYHSLSPNTVSQPTCAIDIS